jgi:hypothetical protein
MRNRLIHGYYEVDLDRVWDTVTANLSPLLAALERIIETDEGTWAARLADPPEDDARQAIGPPRVTLPDILLPTRPYAASRRRRRQTITTASIAAYSAKVQYRTWTIRPV